MKKKKNKEKTKMETSDFENRQNVVEIKHAFDDIKERTSRISEIHNKLKDRYFPCPAYYQTEDLIHLSVKHSSITQIEKFMKKYPDWVVIDSVDSAGTFDVILLSQKPSKRREL